MYKCHDSTILFIWSNSLCAIAWYDQISISSFARLIIIFWNYTTRIVIFFFLSKVRERENHLSSFFFLVYFRYQTSRFVCSFLLVIFSFLSFFFYYFSFFCSIEIWKKFIFDHSICIHTCIHTLTYMYIHIYSRRSTWVARIGWQDRLF